ncbi:uncharacterized protein LOC124435689 [Xenia sp. Carnegie-2017]|uniref:uncharacterized protein LOC124435689 n=1 Tax=Xenia sp. Carnegie-2017 TaxID=2897299 RepID=UPI001F04286C|nr:uncharacterized protein LOC124435689 [Xenia sp. Carnegie-2017]
MIGKSATLLLLVCLAGIHGFYVKENDKDISKDFEKRHIFGGNECLTNSDCQSIFETCLIKPSTGLGTCTVMIEMEKKSLSKLGRACDSHRECLKSDVFAVCLRRTCVDIPLGSRRT